MLRAKLYAITAARALLLLFFSVLFTVAFALYIVLMVADWFIGFYAAYVQETKELMANFHEQLNNKQ